MIELRDYQKEMIGGVYKAIRSGKKRILLIALMGLGKTVISSWIMRDATTRGKRCLFLVPLTVLIDQTIEQVISEGFGKGRKALRNLLRLEGDGYALKEDITRSEALGYSCYSRDMSNHEATRQIHDRLRIGDVLSYCLDNPYSENDDFLRDWHDVDLVPYWQETQRQPRLFGFKLPAIVLGDYSSLTWIVGMILRKFGYRTDSTKIRTGEGEKRLRVYYVTPESMSDVRERILRTVEQQALQLRDTPHIKTLLRGCPTIPIPLKERLYEQYLEALNRGNEELATELGQQLDELEGVAV